MSKYWNKHFKQTVTDGCDELTVQKNSGNDWMYVKMNTNGKRNDEITVRSREQAEQLHFLLGQLLS